MNKIIVTGGTSGLGEAITHRLRGMRHSVFTLSKDKEADICLDLAEPQDHITGAFMEVSDCEILINCAGANLLVPHGGLTDDNFVDLFRLNALSTYFLTELFQPMVVCSVVSDAAWIPMTNSLAYNVSKAAQHMLVRQMAHENRDRLIFGVAPGKIAGTGMSAYIDGTFPSMRGWTYEQGREYQLKGLRTGEADRWDVADFIINLVETASPHYHGHIFPYGG